MHGMQQNVVGGQCFPLKSMISEIKLVFALDKKCIHLFINEEDDGGWMDENK